MGRLRELAQLANRIMSFSIGNFNFDCARLPSPTSPRADDIAHRSKSPLVRCSLRNPLLFLLTQPQPCIAVCRLYRCTSFTEIRMAYVVRGWSVIKNKIYAYIA